MRGTWLFVGAIVCVGCATATVADDTLNPPTGDDGTTTDGGGGCTTMCVGTKSDNDNYGIYGNACVTMTEQCMQDMCCKTGQTICNAMCTDTQTDANNCRMCGKTCSGMTPYCNGGMCTTGILYTHMFTG